MIDIKVLYIIVISIGEHRILPNAENISFLVKEFGDLELVPTSIRMNSNQVLQLSNPEESLLIRFLPDQVEIVKLSKGFEDDIGTFESFIETAYKIWNRLFKKYKKLANRIGIASQYMLKEMTNEALDASYLKFVNPFRELNFDSPRSWGINVVSRNKLKVSGSLETVNTTFDLKRSQGILTSRDRDDIDFDRIELKLDINTIKEELDFRFDNTNVQSFLSEVAILEEKMAEMILRKINEND